MTSLSEFHAISVGKFRGILPGDAVRSFSGSNPIFGGGFKKVFIFWPRKLGKMKPFLSHILGQILGWNKNLLVFITTKTVFYKLTSNLFSLQFLQPRFFFTNWSWHRDQFWKGQPATKLRIGKNIPQIDSSIWCPKFFVHKNAEGESGNFHNFQCFVFFLKKDLGV